MNRAIERPLFTTSEYYHMASAGTLSHDDRVELIEGKIIPMIPIGSHHAGTVSRLNQQFSQKDQPVFLVSVQNPVRLSDYSEPVPDIALLRPRSDFYTQSHPQPEYVLLIIEVADTSLVYDREVKAPLYGQSGIVELWIVDLAHDCVWVYRRPSPIGYQEVRQLERGQQVVVQAMPRVVLAVDDLLGRNTP